jgi:hypothetical protein
MEWNVRGFVWNKKQIESYIKMKEDQDMELLKSVSDSVKSAMDALGGELEKYLEQAGETIKKGEEKESKKAPGLLERFRAEFVGPSKPEAAKKKPEKISPLTIKKEKSIAKKELKATLFFTFKNYKKAHNMIMW